MGFADVSKNQMLDAFTADRVSLHHADPGAAGTANEIDSGTTDYERQTVAWNAAGAGDTPDGERRNNGAVVFNISGGEGDNSKVAFVGLWLDAGTVFKGSAQVTEETFGADGTYTLPDDSGIKLRLT